MPGPTRASRSRPDASALSGGPTDGGASRRAHRDDAERDPLARSDLEVDGADEDLRVEADPEAASGQDGGMRITLPG